MNDKRECDGEVFIVMSDETEGVMESTSSDMEEEVVIESTSCDMGEVVTWEKQ